MLTARSAMVSNNGTARAYRRAPSAGGAAAARGRVDGEHRAERVRVLRPLVRPVSLDPGEAQRDPARVAGAALDAVEGDLDHELGADVDDMTLLARLELQQVRGLPSQHLVGEALERLAQH